MNDQLSDVASGANQIRPKRRRRTGPQWQKLISEQEAGDLSVDAFCDEHEVSPSSFNAWRRRLRRAAERGTGDFVELRARADRLAKGVGGAGDILEVRLGSATLLAPLSSLPVVVSALCRELQR